MKRIRSGSAVPRHLVFVLEDGTFVVQWGEAQVQDLHSGLLRSFQYTEFGHPISDFELDQLKTSGLVEHYTRAYVWLYALPEQWRFNAFRTQERSFDRVRWYYLNTTLPADQLTHVREALAQAQLDAHFSARQYEGVVALLAQGNAVYLRREDAEEAQRRVINQSPDFLRATVVAFIERSRSAGEMNVAVRGGDPAHELADLIASQTDITHTQAKSALVTCRREPDRRAVIETLADLEMTARAAASAQQALYALQDSPPDLFLFDVSLPDMHGWQLLSKLREFHSQQFPLLVAFGEEDAEEGDRVFALTVAKVDLYFVKPIVKSRLRWGVWELFSRR